MNSCNISHLKRCNVPTFNCCKVVILHHSNTAPLQTPPHFLKFSYLYSQFSVPMSVETFIKEKIEEITFTKVSDDDLLWTNKILDSITIIELVVELESEYGIKIPMSDVVLENFEQVSLIANYIERNK